MSEDTHDTGPAAGRTGRGGRNHPGPPLWLLAIISLLLFLAGILTSVGLTGSTPPSPFDSASTMQHYLDHEHATVALELVAFFLFGSSIPLGLYSATVHSRLHYLGIRAAGATIALYGGLGASAMLALSGLCEWVLSRSDVRADLPVARALQDLGFAFGGPGFTVLLGLLLAGIAVTTLITRLLPRGLAWAGLVIAVIGELSHFSLLWESMTPLIPVGRFAGLAWLIAAGVLLPRARPRRNA